MRFVAGRGAVAERHREDVAGRGAEAEMLAGAPWQSFCWPWRCGGATAERRRRGKDAAAREIHREEGK